MNSRIFSWSRDDNTPDFEKQIIIKNISIIYITSLFFFSFYAVHAYPTSGFRSGLKWRRIIMAMWSIPVRQEYNATVYVEADTEEEARDMLESGSWLDSDYYHDLVNWYIQGKIKKEKENLMKLES